MARNVARTGVEWSIGRQAAQTCIRFLGRWTARRHDLMDARQLWKSGIGGRDPKEAEAIRGFTFGDCLAAQGFTIFGSSQKVRAKFTPLDTRVTGHP